MAEQDPEAPHGYTKRGTPRKRAINPNWPVPGQVAPYGYTKGGAIRKAPLKTGAPAKGGVKGPTGKSTTGKVVGVVADQANWRRQLQQSRIKFDDVQKEIYLAAMNEHALKGESAKAAGVALQTVHKHLENDPDFAEKVDEAIKSHADKIVAHHHNLLLNGEITKRFDKEGNVTEEIHKYPVRLIELELKRVEPEYRDKPLIDLGKGGGGVIVAPADISPQDWIARQQRKNVERQAAEVAEAAATEETDK